MDEIPAELIERRDKYCQQRAIEILDLRGYGVDGYVWQTTTDSILKVARGRAPFITERAVYRRLSQHSSYRLHGFSIPCLINSDENQLVLELSYVSPPLHSRLRRRNGRPASAELQSERLRVGPREISSIWRPLAGHPMTA